jgi:hypothetical protein
MAIFGQYQGGDSFNVAGNMRDVLKGQQQIHDSMMGAVEKFNNARQEMDQLQAVSGSILGQYSVDEKGNPDPTAPKYVHDMFKAVNKEGGLANMSKSQMLAGLKAYETGYGLEQQKLAQDAQRENIRGAKIANTAREIELKRLQDAIADEQRIKDARKAKQAEIDAISKTDWKTTKEKKTFDYGGEKIELSNEEVSPFIKIIKDSKSTPQQIEDAKRGIERMVYDKSRISKRTTGGGDYDPYGVGGQVTDESEVVVKGAGGKTNPLFKEFVSAYDKTPVDAEGRREVVGIDEQGRKVYAGAKPSAISREAIESYITRETAKYNKAEGQKDDLAMAEANIAAEEARFRSESDNDPELKRIEGEQRDFQEQLNRERRKLNEGVPFVSRTGQVTYIPLNGEELISQKRKVLSLQNQVKAREAQYAKRSNKLVDDIVRTQKTVAPDPYKTGAFEFKEQWGQEETFATKEIQRSVQEQTDDEYSLMVNYMKANGGVPASFTKDAFYSSKGILRPTVMDLGNGQTYVKIGGVEKIVENKSSASQMTIMDQKRLFDAQQSAKQRNMNGLSVNGYNFNGELRVGDIDTANKVRDGVFKTTRALASVDQMINIAENASMFSKLMPTEISGIAQSLTNAAQAANRTEVGGSGSWSNQDQIYMDKVIRDPSSGFNALFTSQTIASLKEYRKRLEMSMHDAGTVYGFAFEKGGNTDADGLDSQKQQFRVRYSMYLGQGLDKQTALQRAISDTEADYE